MIDIRTADLERYKESLKNRGEDPNSVGKLVELNDTRKSLIQNVESKKAESVLVFGDRSVKKLRVLWFLVIGE